MNVSITHYDDITTPQGEIITMYMVNVQYSTRASYNLAKRYSDFATLHSIVKNNLPPDYKFPNKSLFNNNAQFTKERRIRGFDELLKLLAKHTPFDPNFQAFLEMKQYISPSDREAIAEQMRTQTLEGAPSRLQREGLESSGGGGGGLSRRALIRSVSLKSKIDLQSEENKEDAIIRGKLSHLSNFLFDKTYEDGEDQLTMYERVIQEKANSFRHLFHREFPKLIISVGKTAGIIYFILFLLSIIDIIHVHYSKTFYSFTSLIMILLFFEIKKIRKNLPENQENESKKSEGSSSGSSKSIKKKKKIEETSSSSAPSSPSPSKKSLKTKETNSPRIDIEESTRKKVTIME